LNEDDYIKKLTGLFAIILVAANCSQKEPAITPEELE
jgi:hypothetical protein